MAQHTIITTVEQWFAKAPALPKNVTSAIVSITPWIVLVFGIIGVLVGLAGLGLLTMFSPLAIFGGASGAASYGGGFIGALIGLGASVLLLAAYPGVKASKIAGWNLLFWSEVASLAGSLVSGSIVGGIIGALIGFYILFQIKSFYK